MEELRKAEMEKARMLMEKDQMSANEDALKSKQLLEHN